MNYHEEESIGEPPKDAEVKKSGDDYKGFVVKIVVILSPIIGFLGITCDKVAGYFTLWTDFN